MAMGPRQLWFWFEFVASDLSGFDMQYESQKFENIILGGMSHYGKAF
jgi:hypothetical protein